jgi:hypothetical protein
VTVNEVSPNQLSPIAFSAALERRLRSIACENVDCVSNVQPLAETVVGVGGVLAVLDGADRTQKRPATATLLARTTSLTS